ncbi:MAG: T9SS type A sorting domain-containing protein, partial [Cyclobacteriaceae bacterium]|nr:T9SS type A sorting domain-containing protein [Cyclobacteriaceae bacterium]
FNPITGAFIGSSTCTGCGVKPSMFLYNETEITDSNNSGLADLNDGYVGFPVATNAETLSSGRGYAMFVWGNVPPVSTAGNAKWSVRNPINFGTIDFVTTAGVSFTAGNGIANDGWNLVGNPYPSTIDWSAASGWTKTGIDDAIYMKDNGALAGTYATFVGGVGANGGSRYIPIGQAFWVKANSAPTFQATEAVKAPGNTTTFFRTTPPPDLMRVTLRSGSKRDEIVVYFDEDATEEFDGNKDAYKLKNDIFNLSTVTPLGDKLAINGLPMLECSKSLNLSITDVSVGAYQLDFTEFESFVTPVNIFLFDKKTGEKIDVKTTSTYEFQVTAEESSYKDRFELNIINTTVDPTLLISSTTNGTSCKEGAVTIRAEGAPAGGSYRWYENETDPFAIAGQNSSEFITPVLEKSKTYYVSAVSVAGCEGARVPVMAQVTTFDEVVLSDLENGTLSSSYVDNNQWFKDGVLIPGATGQNYKPIESGVYKVEVAFGTCISSAERTVMITGIEDEDMSGVLIFYPNPVEDVLTVKFNSQDLLNSSIVDMMGRELGTLTMKPQAHGFVGTFDFRSHPGGIYLLKVSDKEGKVITKRIIKK